MMQKRKDILQIDQKSVIVFPKTELIEGFCNLCNSSRDYLQVIPLFRVNNGFCFWLEI